VDLKGKRWCWLEDGKDVQEGRGFI